jgi:hypothetical protein
MALVAGREKILKQRDAQEHFFFIMSSVPPRQITAPDYSRPGVCGTQHWWRLIIEVIERRDLYVQVQHTAYSVFCLIGVMKYVWYVLQLCKAPFNPYGEVASGTIRRAKLSETQSMGHGSGRFP